MPFDTKTALLDAAETAVRSHGYDAFSFADLAAAVAIRKASVHHHFPTKSALAETLMIRYHDTVAARLAQIDTNYPSATDRLRAFVEFYRDVLCQGKTLCLCVSFSTAQNSLPDEVTTRMVSFRDTILAWLETNFSAIHTGDDSTVWGPAEQEAPALLALVEGAQLAARTAQNVAPYDTATQLFIARLS